MEMDLTFHVPIIDYSTLMAFLNIKSFPLIFSDRQMSVVGDKLARKQKHVN